MTMELTQRELDALGEINDKTGAFNGNLFENDEEVREYFDAEEMARMFPYDEPLTQEELDDMAAMVIRTRHHMKEAQ